MNMLYLQIGAVIAGILGSFWLFVVIATLSSFIGAWLDDRPWAPAEWMRKLPFVDKSSWHWMKTCHEFHWVAVPLFFICGPLILATLIAWPIFLIIVILFILRSARRVQKILYHYFGIHGYQNKCSQEHLIGFNMLLTGN